MKPLAADKPDYAVLRALSGPTSPLRELFSSISYETKVSAEPPVPEPIEGSSNVLDAATEVLAKKLQRARPALPRLGLRSPTNRNCAPRTMEPSRSSPVKNIEKNSVLFTSIWKESRAAVPSTSYWSISRTSTTTSIRQDENRPTPPCPWRLSSKRSTSSAPRGFDHAAAFRRHDAGRGQ